MSGARTRVLLIGAHGFGAAHLHALERMPEADLIGTVDPNGAPADGFGSDLPTWASLDDALGSGIHPDVVIIATPTGTHAALAERAMEAGADLYLEKPPVATMAQFEQLLEVQRRTGRAVQVGFQSLGSEALDEIAALGPPTSVAAWGLWVRPASYWRRSRWAGRRTLDGAPTTDGVVTNPLAHAVATALRIAGARRREDVAHVETELLHANDIEADDTSAVRVTLQDGRRVGIALTLCATAVQAPLIEVRTPRGDVVFSYTEDVVDAGGIRTTHARRSLFAELLAHRRTGAPLSSALADCGAFMEVLEAVRTAPEPAAIPADAFRIEGVGDDAHPVVDDIEWWIERTAKATALFRELHVPWASPAPQGGALEVRLEGERESALEGAAREEPGFGSGRTVDPSIVVAVRDDGGGVTASSSPRPHLHPLRSRAGVVVSAAHPIDHDWHLGLSFGLQFAGDVNLWGGRTYTADAGYRWLDDHGRLTTTALTSHAGGFTASADGLRPDGTALLRERIVFTTAPGDIPDHWTFVIEWEVAPVSGELVIGSPGSRGRTGAGYGGLSWRLPAVTDVHVRTPDATGEEAVHGRTAPWIAWSAQFPGGPATIALAGADPRTRTDPWFVRVAGFPQVGSAVAWDRDLRVRVDAPLTRRFHGVVADGRWDDATVDRSLRRPSAG